jgi:hypothetical protein
MPLMNQVGGGQARFGRTEEGSPFLCEVVVLEVEFLHGKHVFEEDGGGGGLGDCRHR